MGNLKKARDLLDFDEEQTKNYVEGRLGRLIVRYVNYREKLRKMHAVTRFSKLIR